jgi:myo-inositol-1(or 4)-monophosphatase
MTPQMRPNRSFASHLALAHQLADIAGKAVMPYFRKPLAVENKAQGRSFDPVTAADRAAERAVRRFLAKEQPDHGMIGEEFGGRGEGARLNWIIDPIDGTKAFIMGSPMWGCLIGLLDQDGPVLGIMDQPFTGERVWSSARGTHWRSHDGRTKRVRTRVCAGPAEAILTTTSPDLLADSELDAFMRLKSRVRMTRYGGDCYGYCLLAAGFVDVIVETGLKAHDVVALIPIIERAGGRITTWDGGAAHAGGRIVATGDPRLHDRVLRVLDA